MSQIHYYCAEGERSKKVQALWEQYVKIHKAREKFRRVHRGTGVVVWRYDKWGLEFRGPPDNPDWKQDKSSGYWLPRARTRLAREMAQPQYIGVSGPQICEAVGVGEFCPKTATWFTPGIEIAKNNELVVLLAEWQKPSGGLVRISDIEYEALMSKPKRRKKVKNA